MLLAWTIDPPAELIVTKSAVGQYGHESCNPLATESALIKYLVTVFGQYFLQF